MCLKLKESCQILRKRSKWSELQVIVAEKRWERGGIFAKTGGILAAGDFEDTPYERKQGDGRDCSVHRDRCLYMAILTKNIMKQSMEMRRYIKANESPAPRGAMRVRQRLEENGAASALAFFVSVSGYGGIFCDSPP